MTRSMHRQCKSFEVFDDELEKQPEFEGFVDLFESYRLRRGKKEYEDEEEDARVVGVFKVSFIHYVPCSETVQCISVG